MTIASFGLFLCAALS